LLAAMRRCFAPKRPWAHPGAMDKARVPVQKPCSKLSV
jgi:hypothetical protein